MKFLIIGLGSMGKRRIRNLIALGYKVDVIAGFDSSERRVLEAEKFGIRTFINFEIAIEQYNPNIFIISTSPDFHMYYAYFAVEHNINCFIEASVVDSEKILKLANIIKDKKIVVAPSCTMKYFPGPQKIKELIRKAVIGKVYNYNYHVGQYLPDWHPWEDIKDFYASNKETGGCREIVPFELTWLNDIFGHAQPLACIKTKLTDLQTEIDDIYHCLLKYPQGILGNLTVDVIARPKAIRELKIIGSEGEIIFSGDSNTIKYASVKTKDWKTIPLNEGKIEVGYINPEEPYINEMNDFITSVKLVRDGKAPVFPNTLEADCEILNTLYTLESISDEAENLSR